MAITKSYTREMHDAGRVDKIQSLTAASTGTTVTNYGVTIVNSTVAKTFTMAAPVTGIRKTVGVVGDSTDTTIDGNGATISGSTAITMVANGAIDLVGTSTAAWAVLSRVSATLS